ncbi:MAG: DUF2783 domain-containing protein [Stellaceae bacterium]
MPGLTTAPNLADPDGVYVDLVRLYDGLDRDASAALSARLILILANHIGDAAVLREAFTLAARDPLEE